jgi:hypothetical protein
VKVILAFLLLTGAAHAQTAAPTPEPFKITDNSFLVEEAFNQERGVFQNIFGALRTGDGWTSTFTQEWPFPAQTDQLSYTIPWVDQSGENGVGDVLLNYRRQVTTEGPGRAAFSPRASLVLPSGSARKGLGSGSAGLQINLPFSKQHGDWYWHWNGGFTWLPRAKAYGTDGSGTERVGHANLVSPFLAGSGIYRLRPMLHLMMESVVAFDESAGIDGTTRSTSLTLSPGVRGGWNFGDRQFVLGLAVPLTWDVGFERAGFGYISYELPFSK